MNDVSCGRVGLELMGSWRRLRRKLVYECQYFKVYEDVVIKPSGKRGKYSFVETGQTVGIIPFTSDKKIFLVGQERYIFNIFSWEIPRGFIEKGETPLVAAKRELLEETGLRARSWQKLLAVKMSIGILNEVCHIYLAKNLLFDRKRKIEEDEKLEVKKVSLKEALKAIRENRITDSLTVLAIWALDDFLKQGNLD